MNGQELWNEIVKQNIPHDHHESDLYLPVNEQTEKLIADYDCKDRVDIFVSQADGKAWYELPFAYEPFWQECLKRGELDRSPVAKSTRTENPFG